MEKIKIIDTNADNLLEYDLCGYKKLTTPGYREKVEWLKNRFSEGLRIKTLYSIEDGTLGMIEYIPGEWCWRAVEAHGYMFIHCLVIMKRAYKGKGYGSLLLNECLNDAIKEHMHGVAVVTRKSTFMVDKHIFLKNGFVVVDKAPPDFELLVKRFHENNAMPKFKGDWKNKAIKYGKGLSIIKADQCPYSVKNVEEIIETAQNIYGLKPTLIKLKTCEDARNTPCAFGTFCIVYSGEVIADHPISNTRFKNIMNKIAH